MDSVELLVNVTPNETRIALVETGLLKEVHIERQDKRGIVGNIYKGRVTRVLPGMQSAFVDIGLEKAAFLHASDIVSHTECVEESEQKQFVVKDIAQLVHEGQDIVVQVVKDPLGTKGARLTTDITLPSRYLVFMPENSHVGVSQRIESEEERNRLKALTLPLCDELGGFIIRTAAEGATELDLQQDADFLKRLWRKVLERRAKYPTRSMLYGELALTQRILRDFIGGKLDRIHIDSRLCFNEVKQFTEEFIPNLTDKLILYTGNQPLFDVYSVEKGIHHALDRRVNLKSGGYLIIEQTEAMTTIDINTGAFVGHRNLEETIFNTNIEATQAIAQQLQLRNLGGIIIIDFIDMQKENQKKDIVGILQRELKKDKVKSIVCGMTSLGLVEMTRKRTTHSLIKNYCDICPICNGTGHILSVQSVIQQIHRELETVKRYGGARDLVIRCHPEVAALLKEEQKSGYFMKYFNRNIMIEENDHSNREVYSVLSSLK